MIKLNDHIIEQDSFGDGTLKCALPAINSVGSLIVITWCYDNDAELFTLWSLVCYIKDKFPDITLNLAMPYIPHARQDREAQVEVARAEAQAIQLKSIEIARTLGFTIDENMITNEDGTTSIEYVIDFEGKSAEEIAIITDYLKYMEYLAKWDGELPNVMTDSSATIVVPTT